jgi:hypothetical protein
MTINHSSSTTWRTLFGQYIEPFLRSRYSITKHWLGLTAIIDGRLSNNRPRTFGLVRYLNLMYLLIRRDKLVSEHIHVSETDVDDGQQHPFKSPCQWVMAETA